MTVSPAVIAGFRCAPLTSARTWISRNSAKTWTSPIPARPMRGRVGGPKPAPLPVACAPTAAHAGIDQAVASGRDRAHGVHLVVRQPSASTDSLKLLASGRATMAVVDIHDLGLARERGEDLVGVG